jgi:Carboxypeptidase regulatory-like domain
MLGNPARAAAVASVALAVHVASVAVAREAHPIAGIVRDILGHAIADAEVLISDGQMAPVAVLRSDRDGRVFFADLPAGPYRVAAIKDGYFTIVDRLDSRARAWIELVLEPAIHLEPSERPDDAWGMRLPRRYLLHEVEDAPLTAALVADRVPQIGAVPLEVQVDHVAVHPGGGGTASREGVGTETSVRVASGVGSRGGIEVQGYRHATAASRATERDSTSTDRDAAGVRVGFSIATEPDSDLAVSAFWGRSDLGYVHTLDSIAASTSSLTREQRSWGYGASWSKPISSDSRLDLMMDYRDTAVSRPPPSASADAAEPAERFTSRAVAAGGTYLVAPTSAHEVQVQFGARMLEAADILRVAPGASPEYVHGLPGLSVGVEARDRWSVAGRAALIWGLGYRHSVEPFAVAIVVPRVGGAWRVDDAEVTATLAYHGIAGSGSTTAGPGRSFRGSGDLGYELSATIPLGSSLRLSGGTSYAPSQLGLETCRPRVTAAGPPMFVSDGDVAVHEQRIALARKTGSIRGSIDVLRGSANGALDTVLPVDAPIYQLAERNLRYVGGDLGLRAVRAGTSVTVSYRQIFQSGLATAAPDAEELQLRSIELTLAQDLFSLRSLGSWRALLGVRTAEADSSTDEDDARILSATGNQFRAGISVLF